MMKMEIEAREIMQLVGLVRLTDFNLAQIGVATGKDEHLPTYNALFSAYAALEALILETAIQKHRDLYHRKAFRHMDLMAKFDAVLHAEERDGEAIPEAVGLIAKYRRAVTHSEPDNKRIVEFNDVLLSGEVRRVAGQVLDIARWLWRGEVPSAARELGV
jgi:hypothetical protein